MKHVKYKARFVRFSIPQDFWLYHESKRLGVSFSEVLRRIVDEARLHVKQERLPEGPREGDL